MNTALICVIKLLHILKINVKVLIKQKKLPRILEVNKKYYAKKCMI